MKTVLKLAALSIILAAAAGCGPSPDEVDIADVNARDALDQLSGLRSRVDELEFEVQELRDELQREQSERQSEDANMASEIANHYHF